MRFTSQLAPRGTPGTQSTPGPWGGSGQQATEWLPACLQKYGLTRFQLGWSAACLRFQAGTSWPEGKWLGKSSHLASFHMEGG